MAAKEVPTLELDAKLAKVLIDGVRTTLGTMFGVEATAGEHRVELNPDLSGDISGIVGMVQEKSEGVLILAFEKAAIFFILEKLYRRKFTEIEKSVRDGVGEITNIIYGILKKNLNDNGYIFKQAIPTVVVGNDHSITNITNGKTLLIEFKTAAGKFNVVIAVQP